MLLDAQSALATKNRNEYEKAIEAQGTVCGKLFRRPLSVVCGAAGTGKTTVIRAILQAIEKAHGADATFLLLAPTGNADRSQKNEEESLRAEEMFQRLQDLPADGAVDKDLRVIFWKDSADLLGKLISRMVEDMEADTGTKFDPKAPHKLWLDSSKTKGGSFRPDYHQVISPYIHEEFGTEAVNLRLQKEARGESLKRVGAISGITLFDKVIQTRNRGASDPLHAYNFKTKVNEPCEVFNGELGY